MLVSLFQVLKSIYNGIYKSMYFTYVNNKILNINTLLIRLLRKNIFKNLLALIEIGKNLSKLEYSNIEIEANF